MISTDTFDWSNSLNQHIVSIYHHAQNLSMSDFILFASQSLNELVEHECLVWTICTPNTEHTSTLYKSSVPAFDESIQSQRTFRASFQGVDHCLAVHFTKDDDKTKVTNAFDQFCFHMIRALAQNITGICQHKDYQAVMTQEGVILHAHDLSLLSMLKANEALRKEMCDTPNQSAFINLLESGHILFIERASPFFTLRVNDMSHVKDTLTDRELLIACLVSQCLSNKDIAVELGISNKTVENHLTKIYQKLGVRSRAELVVLLKIPSEINAPVQ